MAAYGLSTQEREAAKSRRLGRDERRCFEHALWHKEKVLLTRQSSDLLRQQNGGGIVDVGAFPHCRENGVHIGLDFALQCRVRSNVTEAFKHLLSAVHNGAWHQKPKRSPWRFAGRNRGTQQVMDRKVMGRQVIGRQVMDRHHASIKAAGNSPVTGFTVMNSLTFLPVPVGNLRK